MKNKLNLTLEGLNLACHNAFDLSLPETLRLEQANSIR